jgi:hypothetical protein
MKARKISVILQWFINRICRKHKRQLKETSKNYSQHGLYEDGSYVPDWIYNGHYDCGDKD